MVLERFFVGKNSVMIFCWEKLCAKLVIFAKFLIDRVCSGKIQKYPKF
jgi:hypothetical protein